MHKKDIFFFYSAPSWERELESHWVQFPGFAMRPWGWLSPLLGLHGSTCQLGSRMSLGTSCREGDHL